MDKRVPLPDADPAVAERAMELDTVDDDAIILEDGDEIELLRTELAEGRRALEELELTVVTLQKELHEERETTRGLSAKLADTEARAGSLSEVLDDSLVERETSDRAWTARLAEAERAAEEARSEAEASRAEAEAAKIEAIVARGEAEAATLELGKLADELAALRPAADAAPPERAPAPNEKALEAELAAVRAEREQLQDDLAAELATLARELTMKGAEAARLGEEVEELREENAFLGTEVDRYAARVRELEGAKGSA